MVDISKFEMKTLSEQGVEMKLLHPVEKVPLQADDGEFVTLILAGPSSDRYLKARKATMSRNLASRNKMNNPDEIDKEVADLYARCIVSWKHIDLDGQPLECNYMNAFKLLMDPAFKWFYDQVADFITDTGNFIKAS